MDKDIKVGEEAVLRMLDGVLEVGRERVDVGEEGVCLSCVPGGSNSIVNEVPVGVERICEGVECKLLYLSSAYLCEGVSLRGRTVVFIWKLKYNESRFV